MLQRGQTRIFILFILSLVIFGIAFYEQGNLEFIAYQINIIIYGLILLAFNYQFKLPNYVNWGFLTLACLHMLGGVNFGQGLMYGKMLIPINETYPVLRYDQVVHFIGSFFTAVLLFHLLHPSLKKRGIPVHVTIALAAIGVGAVVETTEFFVAQAIPDNFVGEYVNISLDLIFNALGAISGTLWVRKK